MPAHVGQVSSAVGQKPPVSNGRIRVIQSVFSNNTMNMWNSEMQKILIIVSIVSFSTSCAAAPATQPRTADVGAGSSSNVAPYQRAVHDIMEGASLTFGKLTRFCATQEGKEDISKYFESYLRNIETGSRAGFIAVGTPDNGEAALTAEGKAAAARTGDNILNSAKSDPRLACMKLESEFKSGTEIKFKSRIIEGMQAYKQKRHAFCARLPRPSNCSVGE